MKFQFLKNMTLIFEKATVIIFNFLVKNLDFSPKNPCIAKWQLFADIIQKENKLVSILGSNRAIFI